MDEEEEIEETTPPVVNGTPEKDDLKEAEDKKYNKILTWILILSFVGIVGVLSFYMFNQSLNKFNDGGFNYDIIKDGKLSFYHTSFVIYDNTKKINYNVYLRTDPRELQKIEFEGEMNKREMLVLNNTDEFGCGGKGVIAIANMVQILNAVKIKAIIDPNATCDSQGRYTIVDIQYGNETMIEQYGPSCYKIYVKDCKILEGTERYVVEVLKDSNVLNETKKSSNSLF